MAVTQDSASWLLKHRVTIPSPIAGHLPRPALKQRCMPTRQRLTILLAGGGFGKTTLLAECCRELRHNGVTTAWLSLDDEEDALVLDNYVAFAFREAGLDVLEAPRVKEAGERIPRSQTDLVVRALEARAEPCVLALDELERLRDPASVALISGLPESVAGGLHVAVACRELPIGLKLANDVLEGHAEVLTARDLRFSREDITRFLGHRLSQREVSRLAKESAGWPIAVRIRRNVHDRSGLAEAVAINEVIGNWVETNLWHGLSDAEREFVLDVGLLEWFDADLLDRALGQHGAMARLEGLPGLEGLIEPVGRGRRGVRRLHPLVRDYCGKRRQRETPNRFRAVHRGVAMALAERGETVTAMRHADAAGDRGLVAQILMDAGGARLWFREGADRLFAAQPYLTEEIVAEYPRLALVRLVILMATRERNAPRREVADALQRAEEMVAEDDPEMALDLYVVRAAWSVTRCLPMDSKPALETMGQTVRIAEQADADPVVRGVAEYGLCYLLSNRAEFDLAVERGERAKRRAGGRAPYVEMLVDFQLGQVAMAQGRVHDAVGHYRRGRRLARSRFLRERDVAGLADILDRELELERNGVSGRLESGLFSMDLYGTCPEFSAYAAASEVAAEVCLESLGVDQALATVEEMREFAFDAELASLRTFLAALHVSLLADAGRVGLAEQTWQTSALPTADAACLDLETRAWREVEALACARLRLLAARGDFDAARCVARDFVATATKRGLRRAEMRGLALWVAIEERAGHRSAAVARLATYLQLYAETDYAGPLARLRDIGTATLEELLATTPDPACGAPALLGAVTNSRAASIPAFGARELDVLQRLATQTDLEIAGALGITVPGVRYYVKHIFQKLGVRRRLDAVGRARLLGVLGPLE